MVMALCIALYVYSSVAFLHVHYSVSGEVIVHSHPHSDSRDGNDPHKHSNIEFKAISLLNKATASIVISAPINLPIPNYPRFTSLVMLSDLKSQCVYLILSGRSPPFHFN